MYNDPAQLGRIVTMAQALAVRRADDNDYREEEFFEDGELESGEYEEGWEREDWM